jgi:hypothetical protein|tara:strand:- start:54 stop:572 length:519 start_codon:yes stop_codon:yes gene_type:complete
MKEYNKILNNYKDYYNNKDIKILYKEKKYLYNLYNFINYIVNKVKNRKDLLSKILNLDYNNIENLLIDKKNIDDINKYHNLYCISKKTIDDINIKYFECILEYNKNIKKLKKYFKKYLPKRNYNITNENLKILEDFEEKLTLNSNFENIDVILIKKQIIIIMKIICNKYYNN